MKKFTKGLLFGAAVGTVTGLLSAPRSGKETRKKLTDEIEEYIELKNEITEGIENVENNTENLKATATVLLPVFMEGIKQDIANFRFQADPRIAQIKEQLIKISEALPEMPEETKK